jgi:hypothetical protein
VSPQRTACEYVPMACGAAALWIGCFMLSLDKLLLTCAMMKPARREFNRHHYAV